MKHKSNGMYS